MKQYMWNASEDNAVFVDRSDIRKYILHEIEHKMQNKDYFNVVSIYGMGGIGKSSLLNEIRKEVLALNRKYRFLNISFEVENSKQYIESLIKICNAYDKPCILFSYAAMLYWERTSILQLNTQFIKKLESSFLTDLFDVACEISGDSWLEKINISSIPSISNILNCVGNLIYKIKQIPYLSAMEKIRKMTNDEILGQLPVLLGNDIFHNEYIQEQNTPLICFFDSYQQSIPYSESIEWLLQLIGAIHRGLFIVTSRERLLWSDKEHDIYPYELNSYPEAEAEKYLSMYIRPEDQKLIPLIIANTQCVPIYIELAISIYQKEILCDPYTLVDKALFEDRNALAIRFINHLKPEWQEVIINLAIVRVFNKNIFCHIIRAHNINCPFYDYDEIVNVSLMRYIENTKSLIKIHEVFCSNVARILPPNHIVSVLDSYLDYIILRQSYKETDDLISILLTLFINILHIEQDFSVYIDIPICIIEKTLDLFFMLSDIKVAFTPVEPDEDNNSNINQMIFFIDAILYKSSSTKKAIKYLNKITDSKLFGRHKISYDIFRKYTLSLSGDYESLRKSLEKYRIQLSESDKIYWYYMQIELYTVDFYNMDGKFIDSYQILNNLEEQLTGSIFSADNFYQIHRYKGHLFRFNLFFDKAVEEYEKCLSNTNASYTKAYIYTNLIESKCYFDPEYVEKNFSIALSYAESEKQVKNIGKLYYAKAISDIVRKDYISAEQDIKKSIKLNQKDGYQSGKLFAYMAQAYLEYAQFGQISQSTFELIDTLLMRNNVYRYFRLPLAIIKGDKKNIEKIRSSFQWIDFNHTLEKYLKFFNHIKNTSS